MGKSAHKVSCDEAKLAPVLALHPRRTFCSEPLVEHELERLRAGEPAAVAALYDQHHAALRAFCQRLLGDAAAAEDLVHDTFLGLPRALVGYRSDAPLRTFLFGVAVNHCRHHLRAAARRRRAMARYAEATPPEAATLHDLRSEQTRALRYALDRLPIKQRVVFVLSAVQELSIDEVASVVSAPVGTVKSRLHYARAALQRRLSEVLR